ncbi:MAG TPA: DcaP family trimeric outer membrane transporter [Flavitalea sp.]|nr:DcaP family trimeric outer membrane transporter [Flavitalea sp.]
MERKLILLLIIIVGLFTPCYAQTEFDSLKRNSQLDTLYQPSQKPTFVTEFAELKISGFVQPAVFFDNNNYLNNDQFVTSEIPTTQLTDIKFQRFHISANQSRLGFGFKFPKAARNISALLEGDFLSSTKGAHTYFRLRHAYITFGEFTIGQTWTNFGDVSAGPNTLDLEGPNSMPASRVAQIKWRHQLSSKLILVLAIEEPKSDYTPLDSATALKASMPEFVIKPRLKFKDGHWATSLIYKPLLYTDQAYSFKKKIGTWGFTTSVSKQLPDRNVLNPLKLKKQTISIFGIIGEGTQGAVNDFGGLGYEAFPKTSTSLASLLYYGGYISYSFVFKKRWSSTYVYSYLHQESPKTTQLIFKQSNYFSANAIYAFNKYFTAGFEVLYGQKENYDNTKGSAIRLLGIMRLLF